MKKFQMITEQIATEYHGFQIFDWEKIDPVQDFILYVGFSEIKEVLMNKDLKDYHEVINKLMHEVFHKDLAVELLHLSEEHSDITIHGIPLAVRVADWISSQSPPDVSLAKLLLSLPDEQVQEIAAKWIYMMFSYESSLLNIVLNSKNKKVVDFGKKWFQRIKGELGTYRIKKIGEELNITCDGERIDVQSMSPDLLKELSKIPYDVVLQAKQFIIDIDRGEQLVVEDLDELGKNNLQYKINSVQKRLGMLNVLAGAMGWDSMESLIINHAIFYQSMK